MTIESKTLCGFFERIAALSLRLAPHLGTEGLDGTVTRVALFGDLFSAWHFQWWNDPPESWKPLVEITGEMFDAFEKAVGLNFT